MFCGRMQCKTISLFSINKGVSSKDQSSTFFMAVAEAKGA